MKIEIKSETILPNAHQKVEQVVDSYKFVKEVEQELDVKAKYEKIEQEENVKIEYVEDVKQEDVKIEYVEELKQEEDVKIDIEYNEIYDDSVTKNYEKNVDEVQDEMFSKNSDNPGPSNSQIMEINLETNDPAYYECNSCCKTFPNSKILKKPSPKVHKKKVFERCPVCNKMIAWMKEHMKTHSKEKPYFCDICGLRFRGNSYLNRHLRLRHPEHQTCQHCKKSQQIVEKVMQEIQNRDYQCRDCDRVFTKKASLYTHSLIHEENKFFCSVCKKGFARKYLLNLHLKIHTDERPYACDECGKAFKDWNTVITHKRIHANEKPHICSVCSKAFNQSNYLKWHMKQVHFGEKPHSCEVCDKAFLAHTALKIHMRIHTREKPYTCEVCSKAFTQSTHLKTHMRTHTGKKPYYSCDICGKSFMTNGNLTLHKKRCHA